MPRLELGLNTTYVESGAHRGGRGEDLTSFISTWDTTGSDETVTLPFVSSGSIDFTIDWGDGGSDTVTAYDDDLGEGAIDHVYSSAATYTITLSGTIRGFKFDNGGSKTKIKTITQWGTFDISVNDAFYGCTALNVTATDAPTISSTDLRNCFSGCTSLTAIGGDWDVSSVQIMVEMFFNTSLFNGDISNWDVSSVTTMEKLFYQASIFNQPIGSWDVSSVTNMYFMFGTAMAFNQPLAGWGSTTSNVTNMSAMFKYAFAFNQPIEAWDVSKVTTFAYMFQGLWNNAIIFNQDLSDWDTGAATTMATMFSYATSFEGDGVSSFDIADVTTMAGMFDGANALTRANYDALLIAWELQTEQTNVVFHAGDATYSAATSAAATARARLVTNGWTITDGGSV